MHLFTFSQITGFGRPVVTRIGRVMRTGSGGRATATGSGGGPTFFPIMLALLDSLIMINA